MNQTKENKPVITNRQQRRHKGNQITIADIRGLRARLLLNGMYKKHDEPETK